MSCDPADVGHAPVNIFWMDVLNVFGGSCDIGHVAAGAVLATLGFSGCAACVHQKERGFRRHRHRINAFAVIVFQQIVDDKVTTFDQRGGAGIFAGISLPDQNFFQGLALFLGFIKSNIRLFLVINHGAAAVVTVDGDQDITFRVLNPVCGSLAAESAKYLGVNNTKASASQHGNGKLRCHGHMQRYPVSGL